MFSLSDMNLSKRIGLGCLFIHSVFFIVFSSYLNFFAGDGQWQLFWIVFLLIDFPVSLLLLGALGLISVDSQYGEAILSILPYVIHGILGGLWWYMLPQMLGRLFSKISDS